jgi:hypothetical protein
MGGSLHRPLIAAKDPIFVDRWRRDVRPMVRTSKRARARDRGI